MTGQFCESCGAGGQVEKFCTVCGEPVRIPAQDANPFVVAAIGAPPASFATATVTIPKRGIGTFFTLGLLLVAAASVAAAFYYFFAAEQARAGASGYTPEQIAAIVEERDELRERIAQVANEKAAAQDEAANTLLTAAALADIVDYASNANAQLIECIDGQRIWTDMMLDMALGYSSMDSYTIDRYIQTLARICGNARADSLALIDYLESL